MNGFVSFDLVMEDDMPFVEGCYRVDHQDWSVFTIVKSKDGLRSIGVKNDVIWASGVSGINIVVDDSVILDLSSCIKILQTALDLWALEICSGPDSMAIR